MLGRTAHALSVRVVTLAIFASFFQNPVKGTAVDPRVLDACPGYNATNIKNNGPTLTADLVLNGKGCNVFGPDVQKLTLNVVYETGEFMVVEVTVLVTEVCLHRRSDSC